jgi:putative cell wall-binding protein
LAVLALGAITVVSGIAVIGAGTAGASPTNVSAGQVSSLALGSPYTPAPVYPGVANQPATPWTFTLQNTFANLDTLVIDLPTCLSATDFVGYAATPTVSVVPEGGPSGDTTPTFVATLGAQTVGEGPLCAAAGVKDELHITLTDSSSAGATVWDVTISGISYTVGSAFPASRGFGDVTMGHGSTGYGAYVSSTESPSTPAPVAIAANATIPRFKITANTPPVGLLPGSTNQAISNVVLTEFSAGFAGAQTYTTCSGAEDGQKYCAGNNGTFSNTSHPTFSVTGGTTAAVNPVVTVSGGELSFTITTASSTPATYTLSGLVVNAYGNSGPVTSGLYGFNATPANDPVIYTVIGSSRIQGQVATDTSALLFQRFGYDHSHSCLTTAVLATSDNYPDALSAAYLAGNYNTAVIITPTAAVAQATLDALRLEGVENVLVVGGPLAISPGDIATLQSTQSYTCGNPGAPRIHFGGAPWMLNVTQIYGQDQYGTAQQVAQYVAPGNIFNWSAFPGAYGGTYNDTTGANGTAATSAQTNEVRTAILATGVNFPDAMAASATSWNESMPILLTEKGSLAPEASAAILNLGIAQVIVMGGPDAISDNVLTQLEAMGVTVFRIAGIDMTDTAQLLAQFELNRYNASNVRYGLGWYTDHGAGLTVTRGDNWQDALSASAFAGRDSSPLLVTFDPNTVGTYLTAFLNAAGSAAGVGGARHLHYYNLTILGGPYAISAATATTMVNDLTT